MGLTGLQILKARSVVRRAITEQLEPRLMMNRDWQNPNRPLDINNDLLISPLDALLSVNRLNSQQSLTVLPARTRSLDFYYDASGDGNCTPLDALLIINELNSSSAESRQPIRAAGEAETAPSGFVSVAMGQAPGTSVQIVSLVAELSVRRKEFNELGIFVVDSADGRINGIAPDDARYPQEVFQSSKRQVLFSRRDEYRPQTQVSVPGGSWLRVYSLQPSTGETESSDHLRVKPVSSSHMSVGWEEYASTISSWPVVGDRGYDDALVQIRLGTPVVDNAAPSIVAIPDQTIDELNPLRIQPLVFDANLPNDVIRFNLDAAPPGASIDSVTGLFSWTPGEVQGPGVYNAVVRATDSRGAFDTEAFRITVAEVNLPPILEPIANRQVQVGQTVSFVASAADPDVPANLLTYQLVTGGGLGATIDSRTGRFDWSIPSSTPVGDYRFSVRVTDDGAPELSDTKSFTVAVARDVCAFSNDLVGWAKLESGGTVPGIGTVTGSSCVATLREGNSFLVGLERNFTVPAIPSALRFQYQLPAFDTRDSGFIKDAFEVAFVDAQGFSLLTPYTASRDAFFNITEGLPPRTGGSAVSIEGNSVLVSLAGVPSGSQGRLIFRLVNNDADTNSSVVIEQAELINTSDALVPAKFFVADATAGIFRHASDGRFLGTFAAGSAGANLRGASSIADGSSLWTIATDGTVYVQNADGSVRGSWQAGGLSRPEGIEAFGQNVWIVDASLRQVSRYDGAALRTSGTATSSNNFKLVAANSSPTGIASDGTRLFVTDDAADSVFVYALDGTSLGSWRLDTANADASDLTTNPAGGSELWVVDRVKRQIFQYDRGTTFASGDFPANSVFALVNGNSSPEGLADPPQTPAGHSQLDADGRAIFNTADDFRQGTLFNLTATDAAGDIRLNNSDETEFVNIIWIANSGEGTISKFDTTTGNEIGRYRTGQEGTALYPNRTGVTSRGDVWVNNREQSLGTVVKVLHEGFVDRNGNGVLDTSADRNGDGRISSDEILPWDANQDGQPDDERIAMVIPVGWDRSNSTQQVAGAMGRSLVVDENDNIWVGFWNARQYELYDGVSGERKALIPVNGTAYNAAIDAQGVLWSTSAQIEPHIDRIDTKTLTHLGSITNRGGTRGITIDARGLIWFGTWEGTVVRHDPIADTWDTYNTGIGGTSGVAVDSKGRVWAGSFSSGVTRLTFAEDRRSVVETKVLSIPGGTPSAVFDSDGYFWTIARDADLAYKIDPETVTIVEGYPIPTGREPYNYTNNTAQVRATVTQRTGRWTEIIDSGRLGTVWGGVGLDALKPVGTNTSIRVRASDTATSLASLPWRETASDTVIQGLLGRFVEVEISLTSSRADLNPSVQSVTVTSIAPPKLELYNPEEGATLGSRTTLVLDGQATATQPEFGPGLIASNRIVAVTINGEPVDVLDATGRFYSRVSVRPGENAFIVVATDSFGQTTSLTRSIFGESLTNGSIDMSQLVDLSAGFRAEYGRTSFREREKELYADIVVRNVSQYPAGVPLYVAVKNISDPLVVPLGVDGTLLDGSPYYDFTGLVTGGALALAPNAATGTLSLTFANPNRGRFSYDLVFLGVPNRPPVFTSVPELEATVGRPYSYAASATDPDLDALQFALVTGPAGMVVNRDTGLVTWTPTAAQLGNMPVTLRVTDGRGGVAEQNFTIVSSASRPNRPPVFTSLPIGDAEAGKTYTYDVDAVDPDSDVLKYSLSPGFPTGMSINEATGVITWTPAFTQLGDADIVVVANDGRGGIAQQAFTICVTNNANRPPVIVSEPVVVARPVPLIEREVIQYEGEWKYRVVAFGAEPGFEAPSFDDSAYQTGLGGFGSGGGCLLNQTARRTTWPTNSDILLRKIVVLPTAATGLTVRGAIDNDIQVFVNGVEISQGMQTTEGCAERNEFRIAAPDSLLRVGENTIAVRARDRGAESYVDVTVNAELPKDWTSTLPPTEIGAYKYQLAALDPEERVLTYSLIQSPNGMTINATTGMIDWLPSEANAGNSFPVTVRVDDGRGGSDEQRFTVAVKSLVSSPREFDPVVEWHKSTFSVLPASNQVMMTPAVADLDQDGYSDIVFSTYSDESLGWFANGNVRAISGQDGSELWTNSDENAEVVGASSVAVGDIDADGRVEVVALSESYGLIAFNYIGDVLWKSSPIIGPGSLTDQQWGSPSLVDLDGDGTAEIVFGAAVLNSDGTVRWNRNFENTGRGDNLLGSLSAVADLDLDGIPEIIAGRTAYRSDGSIFWNSNIPDGFVAIGNFDGDRHPEIVSVSAGSVYLLSHSGQVVWGPVSIPGGGEGGAPTIADFDNDGEPEIGVAGASRYVVFETGGSVLWQQETQDTSSRATGSSVFDFDGDGIAEVVYGDETHLRIYRGSTGDVLYSLPKSSCTTYEYPVIADVDSDNNAEIIAVANTSCGFGPENGIYVIGDRNNTWVNARKIWNQHTYHITNINDDGTLPRNEANSWELYNTYRTNVLTEGVDPRAAIDLVISSLGPVGTGTPLTFTAKVANTGNAPVNGGVTVALFDGDPAKGGVQVGSKVTTQRLKAGESETLIVSISAAMVNDLWAIVDPDNHIAEFDDDNNSLRGRIDTDSTNYMPRLWRDMPSAQRTIAANAKFRMTLPVVDPDGDAITYTVPTAPDGLMVHAELGVAAWVPKREQVGEHQILMKATDSAGNVTLVPFTVTVIAPDTAPVITSRAPSGPATATQLFEYRVTAQDAEATSADLRYALRTPLAGMSIGATSGVFSWTPTASQTGEHSITILVNDGTTTSEQTFSLNVPASSTNRNPVLSLTRADTSAWLGRNYSAQAVASDPDGDPVRYQLVRRPAGMTIDAQSGVIAWTPDTITSTPIIIEVLATDGRGGSVDTTINLSVYATDSNRAPRIDSNPPATAVHGGIYAYDLAANDPDGDPVIWQLVSAPQGVSLDAQRGTLRWEPAADQIGSHTMTVRAIDPLGALGEQTFTLIVACENQPPNFVSRPQTIAYVNEPYLYAVRAADPEGDALTFSLESAPAGMAFAPGTSLLRWTPTVAQAGPQTVIVKATDIAGNVARQSYTITVSTESPNRPPVITSQPRTGATLGRNYSYSIAARDPDGDALTYSLTEKPTGMQITPGGVISWTPTAAGSHPVTVEVTDGRGGVAVQTYSLSARANQAPALTPLPNSTTVAGATFRAQTRATDPENDPLTFSLTQAPAGMSIDAQGRISWTAAGSPRTETVVVSVSDPDGLTATDEFFLELVNDDSAPKVRILLSADRVNLGTAVTVQVLATDNIGISSLSLTANGAAVALDALGRGTLATNAAGNISLIATAKDTSDNSGTDTAAVRVIDPNVVSDVRANFTRLELLTAPGQFRSIPIDDNSSPDVSYLADVYGTISSTGQPLASWRLLVARGVDVDILNPDIDSPAWREISRGTTTLSNARLGTFDPTMLPNDNYVLAIVAFDVSGGGYVKPTEINVVGNAKLGNFRLEFTDLTIPLVGIPIQITRVYDTLEANIESDFGFGWKLGIEDAKIFEAGAIGQGGALTGGENNFIPDRTKVYLTNPGGQRVGFTYKERLISASFFGGIWAPYFQPDPGVYDTLAIDETQVARGGIVGALAQGINPNFYTLTTKDGMQFRYHDQRGLEKITDRNGNTVTYTYDGIKHSSGEEITFVRDSRGRIREIVDPDGKKLVYEYNATGDLAKFTNQAELSIRYQYQATPAHYLQYAIDPRNTVAMEVLYQRNATTGAYEFAGVVDAVGNRIDTREFTPTSYQGIVRDGNGNATTLLYNERGNVIQQIDAYGNSVSREYNDPRNPDLETRMIDRLGNVTERQYDARGNILQITERGSTLTPLLAPVTTTFSYDNQNSPTSITNPLGATSSFAYDTRGNLAQLVTPEGNLSAFDYDATGRRQTFVDFKNNTTTFIYNNACKCGSPSELQFSDGSFKKMQYNIFGQVTLDEIYASDGQLVDRQEISYDTIGRIVEERKGIGGSNGENALVTRKVYDRHLLDWEVVVNPASIGTNGQLTESPSTPLAQRKSQITDYEYNAADKLVRQVNPETWWNPTTSRFENRSGSPVGVTEIRYDSNGNRVLVQDPAFNLTTWLFDKRNRVVEERDPTYWERMRAANVSYTQLSNQQWVETVAPLVPSATAPGPGGPLFDDPSGVDLSQGRGVEGVRAIGYDAKGNKALTIDRNGRKRTFQYDNRGRILEEKWYATGTATQSLNTATFTYDAAGNLLTASNPEVNYDMAYDVTNRLRKIDTDFLGDASASSLAIEFTYDRMGNLIYQGDSAGVAVNNTYNNRNQLSKQEWSTGAVDLGTVKFEYDAAGRTSLIERFDDNDALAARTTFEWDRVGRATQISHTNALDQVLSQYDYSYDFAGRLVEEDLLHSANSVSRTSSYVYDMQGQIVSAVYSNEQADESFAYDPNGNRLGQGYRTEPANRIGSDGTFLYTHDGEGNIVTKTRLESSTTEPNFTRYSYDHVNRLIAVNQFSNNPATGGQLLNEESYGYDAFGRRVRTSSRSATQFSAYSGSAFTASEWARYDTNGNATDRFLYSSRVDDLLATWTASGKVEWPLKDQQGSVRDVYQESGELATYQYTAFGIPLIDNAQLASQEAVYPFLYTGRPYDVDTGLYDLRARHLLPSIGRFTAMDPLCFNSNDSNLYRYVGNNPLNYTDPTGGTMLATYTALLALPLLFIGAPAAALASCQAEGVSAGANAGGESPGYCNINDFMRHCTWGCCASRKTGPALRPFVWLLMAGYEGTPINDEAYENSIYPENGIFDIFVSDIYGVFIAADMGGSCESACKSLSSSVSGAFGGVFGGCGNPHQ